MTASEGWNIIYLAVVPILIAAGVVSISIWLVAFCFKVTGQKKGFWIYILVFALLGTVIGFAAGNSRGPAISAVLPALLTLVTALCGYAFTVQGLEDLRPVIPFCILALMLSSVYGLAFGAKVRDKYDRSILYYQNVYLEVEKARQLKELGSQAEPQKK